MLLSNLLNEPDLSLKYMERLVNNGSPSNFSFTNMTSKETNPLFNSSYRAHILYDDSEKFKIIGNIPDFSYIKIPKHKDFIFIHPDWHSILNTNKIIEIEFDMYPTSSSRTVNINNFPYYIKMAYPGILGRITRELCTKHIMASIETTDILSNLLNKKNAPEYLAFFPEKGGKVYLSDKGDIGFVVRDTLPIGKNTSRIKAIIPAFALFSKDKSNNDLPIIIQILFKMNNSYNYLLEQIIFPILDCYFFCVFYGGIQPEMHSQNFLLGIDENYNICSIILRDLESIDKDITIMKNLGIDIDFDSYPYKCIEKNQYNYKIKHSFMYDHKLCEYFFDPLLECIDDFRIVDKAKIMKEIRNYVRQKYNSNFCNFFPEDGMWYKFDNVVVDRNKLFRPYIKLENPKYR